jgi:uncharacterized membrane protein
MADALLFVNILCGSLVVGGNFFSLWVLRPTLRRMPARDDLELFRLVSRRVEQYMPLTALLVPVTGVAVLLVDRDVDGAWIALAVGTGLALLSVALIPFDLPIAKRLNAMPSDALNEEEYARLSGRRDRFHLLHLLLGSGTLALSIVSALIE